MTKFFNTDGTSTCLKRIWNYYSIFLIYYLSLFSLVASSLQSKSSSPWIALCKSSILWSASLRSSLATLVSASAASKDFSMSRRARRASCSRDIAALPSSRASRKERCSRLAASWAVCSFVLSKADSVCSLSTLSFNRAICVCKNRDEANGSRRFIYLRFTFF